MPIRKQIKAFWWFNEGEVGGMGRPGFNRLHWSDLPLSEAAVFSWLGQHLYDQPDLSLAELYTYLHQLAPKVAPFFHRTPEEVHDKFNKLHDLSTLYDLLERLNQKAHVLEPGFTIESGPPAQLHCEFSEQQLHHEVNSLKQYGISTLISLMATPPSPKVQDRGLQIYHFPVQDLTPPSHEQVLSFASLLREQKEQHGVAVHCFAGVGRTTTMLVAAHLLYGDSLQQLTQQIEANNPYYQRKGSQWAFLCDLASQVENKQIDILK